MLLKITLSF